MAANTAELRSAEQWKKLCTDYELLVVHFYAAWSQPCRQMNEALDELAKEHQRVQQVAFVKVEAENFPEISIEHKVVAVPTFIFIKGGKAVDRVDGAHVPEVAKKTTKLIEVTSLTLSPPSAPTESLEERLKKLTTATECVLFMKGAPQEPRCGFSRQVIEILNEIGAEYSTFDILVDQEVRQGLKKFSNWPTYPQLYVKGELIGGIDIIKELRETGELSTLLPMAAKKESLEERLKSLINKAPIVVFMKGSPEEPRCGFSRSTCQILKDTNLQFSTFDILQDEEVRQGLKSYSSWPTYPQVYVKGELVGGLDILKELQESGELLSTLQGNT